MCLEWGWWARGEHDIVQSVHSKLQPDTGFCRDPDVHHWRVSYTSVSESIAPGTRSQKVTGNAGPHSPDELFASWAGVTWFRSLGQAVALMYNPGGSLRTDPSLCCRAAAAAICYLLLVTWLWSRSGAFGSPFGALWNACNYRGKASAFAGLKVIRAVPPSARGLPRGRPRPTGAPAAAPGGAGRQLRASGEAARALPALQMEFQCPSSPPSPPLPPFGSAASLKAAAPAPSSPRGRMQPARGEGGGGRGAGLWWRRVRRWPPGL